MKKLSALAAVATMALALGACGDSYDRSDAIKQMKEAGLSDAQATCVVDGVEDEFGIAKLNSKGEPTEEETAKIMEITTGCMTP